jgi:glycerol-3-phosphate O-acyltransferase
MNDQPAQVVSGLSLRLRWQLLLRWVLHLWVRARVLADSEGEVGAPQGKPVCYVMNDYALSSLLILDKCCEQQALPRPLFPVGGVESRERRSYAALRRMQGLVIRRRTARRSSEFLRELLEFSYAHPAQDIQIVPVTVFIGRAPDKTTGFAKVLFSENWQVGGPFRRLMGTLINGRDTLVQFSRPISLQSMAAEALGPERSLRKLSRILRTHFRGVRVAAIGPDLSHRRTLIDGVIAAPAVREAIDEKARKAGIGRDKAEKLARKYAWEVAADYSYRFVRLAFLVLNWFLHRIYDGIRVNNVERLKASALNHEIVYVPCHRSHMDYLLMSFVVYEHGFVPPHVAAGVNLKLPVIGAIIRGGGAFYIRRSFRAQKLYAAVFNEYVRTILAKGVAIEYFVEGTRSRTGRLLAPRGGMLAMTVRGYLASPVRPIMFQPVYISYEQMVEAESYIRELSGRRKRSERLSDLLKVFGVLRRKYGEATISFGQPIMLNDLLESYDAGWREASTRAQARLPWLSPLVDELGERIMTSINAAADVNPVNLLATIMLSTSKHSMDEKDLLAQLALYRRLLLEGSLANQITVTDRDDPAIIEYGFELGLLNRKQHPLGDILSLVTEQAVSLTYFRNNVLHLFAVPSLIACCLLNQRSCSVDRLRGIAERVYPFLRAELFLPWTREEFPRVLQDNIELLTATGLLGVSEDGAMVVRAEGGSMEAGQLSLLGRSLLQTLERYFITIAVLTKNGSGTLTRGQLEKLCILTAQRLSQLLEFEAPEFSDRNLFRGFIVALREEGFLTSDEEGAIEFGESVRQMGLDAHFILSKEIRHGIMRIAPQALESAASGVKIGDEL